MGAFATCPMCGGTGVIDPQAAIIAPGLEPVDAQTLADREQTVSDQDQTWSDHDQTASDRDQRSADEDQRASDADFAAGSDARTHKQSASARAHSSQDRETISQLRDETGAARVESAEARDRSAELRDRLASERDRAARALEEPDGASVTEADFLRRVESDRARAAADRARAAEDRTSAAADRSEAARERAEAVSLKAEVQRDLRRAATDELTGTLTRQFGLEAVEHEIDRARRVDGRLVLAFLDVDGLKEVNDEHGHQEGDRLLKLVADTLKANIRSYDVAVRYGGDEFLCAMPNISRTGAQDRMQLIASALKKVDARHSIAFGLAVHEPADDLDTLVGRADANLLESRRDSTGSTV